LTKLEETEIVNNVKADKWYVDSEATTHMIYQEAYLTEDKKPVNKNLIMPDGNAAKSISRHSDVELACQW
jgi:hypothetical protein